MQGMFTWRDKETGKEYHLESMDVLAIPRENEQVDLVFSKRESPNEMSAAGLFLVEKVQYHFHRLFQAGDEQQEIGQQYVSIYVQPLDNIAQYSINKAKQRKDQEEQRTWEAGKKSKND